MLEKNHNSPANPRICADPRPVHYKLMSKKQASFIVLGAVVLSLAANILFGRVLAAKISTWPLLNRWKILSPEAPIVINTREEVRVNDAADIVQAVSSLRPKLSLVLSDAGGQITALGGAINLTSDGYVLTLKSAVGSQKVQNLFVKLDDGTVGTVSSETFDNATGVVILKTSLQNLSVVNLANSRDLSVGQRLLFLSPDLVPYSNRFSAGFVGQAQRDDAGVRDADAPARAFKAQGIAGQEPGQAIADTSGNVEGLWDGGAVISSDVLQDLSANFLGHQGAIIRPEWGFRYRSVGPIESKILNQTAGIKVVAVTAGGPAQKAGLQDNDIIQTWDGNSVPDSASFEALLARYNPGDKINIVAMRGANQVSLVLTAGQLK